MEDNISNPKSKQRILQDMDQFITNWRIHNPYFSIIVMVDTNSDTTDEHFQAFMVNTSLYDTVEHHSPEIVK